MTETVAAIDLGSNSFHMVIAQVDNGEVRIIDRLREQVQLAAGIDAGGHLGAKAIKRGVACLERFGQRLEQASTGKVRAVGTNTLRRAHNSSEFIERGNRALGHPIEVIAGREEARLIYLGVAHSEADDGGQRLVIDIGGGSTEFIIGRRFEQVRRESLYMGCVSFTQKFFPNGEISEDAWRRAVINCELELEGIQLEYRQLGWDDCVGSSGTVKAVRNVLQAEGWADGGITRKALNKLRKALLKAGHVDRLQLQGLADKRRSIFPAGVVVLYAAFEALGINFMQVSEGALREGLLYDLLGRLRHEDVRERTAITMAERYRVPLPFAEQVANTCRSCFQQVAHDWELPAGSDDLLRWAAIMHRVGVAVAHTQYHKHGAYLLANSDMQGFSRQDQELLAFLIRGHRRKFPVLELGRLPLNQQPMATRLCILLRLAVLLNHGRTADSVAPVNLYAKDKGLRLSFPDGWLADHPLTVANLDQEVGYLAAIKFRLKYA